MGFEENEGGLSDVDKAKGFVCALEYCLARLYDRGLFATR